MIMDTTKRKIFLLSTILCALFSITANAANAVVEGREFLVFNAISALTLPGDHDPSHQANCEQQLSWLLYQHPIETTYRINTNTGIQSAHTTMLGVDTLLHPMGLYKKHKFISDAIDDRLAALQLLRIVYGTNNEFTQGSLVLYFMGEDRKYQCAIDSQLQR